MSKTAAEIRPNYAPVYAAAMYPGLCAIFQSHGYALSVHGSLARDFDLIAVPWAETPSPLGKVLKVITSEYAIKVVGEPKTKRYGRIAYTLSVGFGECAIDLSFIPKDGVNVAQLAADLSRLTPDLARECVPNREAVITNLIRRALYGENP